MKNPTGGSSQKTRKPSKDSTFQPFPVTSPKYSGAWMDEVWTRSIGEAFERARLRLASQSPQKTALTPAPVKPKPGKV